MSIPIIDLTKLFQGTNEERKQVALQIGDACAEVGFFIIKGHNIDQTLIDNTWVATRCFFDQDQEVKNKLLTECEEVSSSSLGYKYLY